MLVEVSTNGSGYTTAGTASQPEVEGWGVVNFAAATGRYVRLTCMARDAGTFVMCSEVQVFA